MRELCTELTNINMFWIIALTDLNEILERGPLYVVELGRQDDARPGAGLSAFQGCQFEL